MSGISFWLEEKGQRAADYACARWPRPLPSRKRLQNCKIVSHRGEHDNIKVFENTLAAFDRAKGGGVWGIEFDLRWTRDLKPVVFHDQDCKRLFGSTLEISKENLAGLRSRFPLIPTLEEVVERYAGKMHLMVEIKKDFYPDPHYQKTILRKTLSPLKPQEDFHLLSLTPEMFGFVDFLPASVLLPVARLNIRRLSALAVQNNYAGIAGHYLFLTDNLIKRHRRHRQMVGTGYVSSRNCLLRELNRGVDWIFSNNALEVQAIRDSIQQEL